MASGPENKPEFGMPGMGMGMGMDLTSFFSRLQLPIMPDMDAVLAAHRRNMETLTQANRIALEGAQTVARRNMEIMQQSMGEITETLRSLSTTDAPQAKAAKQAELVKTAYERAVTNMKEIGDLIQKSNSEAIGLLNRRFTEAMDEVKTLVAKKGE